MMILDRENIYYNYAIEHPKLGPLYKRLATDEKWLIVRFFRDNAKLDSHAFEKALNRLFLDKQKPKHWKEILELLSCSNSEYERVRIIRNKK